MSALEVVSSSSTCTDMYTEGETRTSCSKSTSISEVDSWNSKASQTLQERVYNVCKSKITWGSAGLCILSAVVRPGDRPILEVTKLFSGMFGVIGLGMAAILEFGQSRDQVKAATLLKQFAQNEEKWRKAIPKPAQGDTFSTKDLPAIASFLNQQTPFEKYDLLSYQTWDYDNLSKEEKDSLVRWGKSIAHISKEIGTYKKDFFYERNFIMKATYLITLVLDTAAKTSSGEEKEFFEKANKDYLGEILLSFYAEHAAKEFSSFVSFAKAAHTGCFYPSSEKLPSLSFHALDKKTFAAEIWKKLGEKTEDLGIKQKLALYAQEPLIV